MEICVGQADVEISKKAKEQGDFLLEVAFDASRMAGLKQEALLIRAEMAMKNISSEIDGDCANKIIIIKKHGPSCVSLYKIIKGSN